MSFEEHKNNVSFISSEIIKYRKIVSDLETNQKIYIQNINNLKEIEDNTNSEEYSRKLKILRMLLKENEEIREKIILVENVYDSFINSMNNLVIS